MHKAVDKWAQAPACNAVKMGGEKMTSRSRAECFPRDRSDPGRIGKVACAPIAAMRWPAVRPANARC
ncbi:hypothetical protein XaCFBP7622_07320 [Xanthomonas arboricola]|nr:hypothetical protein XaCFBP7622_07320 [Xanthomonas arboricola]